MSRIDRKKRARKLERRAVTPEPQPRRAITPDPGMGSTFRAARIRREVAAAIPDVLYSAPAKPATKPRRAAQLNLDQAAKRTAAKAKVDPSTKATTKPEQVTMRERPTCKSRPKGGTGDGNSRAFVPWCDR